MIGRGAGIIAAAALTTAAPSALAGAWTQPRGQAQVIVKAEAMRADDAYDADGQIAAMDGLREDRALSLFGEYGLTDRLTLQLKADWQSGEDAYVDYNGRGPVELGLTWQAYRGDRAAASLYAGYAQAGDGRNAGYAEPGVGRHDWEVRASGGLSLPGGGRWGPDRSFIEVQAARRLRDGLPDETRADLTVGGHYGPDWLVLGQVFAGAADRQEGVDGARWVSVETSLVRHLGRWSVQAGWRQTVAGRDTPRAQGMVLGLWRRF
ncbi:MAG: hypothetical protein EON91_00955 [Brevundimonas sp.]|uniref:hypothetical protein n=1 Tax=Brevundimonas sp. TaxID=1871086 RepID=UPI00120230D4|nr:hypothetical protein [Brevundimonas sp.]RZJ19455.1 MAG: hypothetical protein EON91_00955 [Brevundimonas sp.]